MITVEDPQLNVMQSTPSGPSSASVIATIAPNFSEHTTATKSKTFRQTINELRKKKIRNIENECSSSKEKYYNLKFEAFKKKDELEIEILEANKKKALLEVEILEIQKQIYKKQLDKM